MNAASKTRALLAWIASDLGRPVRVVDVNDRYENTPRTFRRWLDALAEAGFVWVERGRAVDRTITLYRSNRPEGGRVITDPAEPSADVVNRDLAWAPTSGLRVDPRPCKAYPWPEVVCLGVYSGAHACARGAGHAGPCVCAQCGSEA